MSDLRHSPLAYRLRPSQLHDVSGQDHLVGEKGSLRQEIEAGTLGSVVFWGPPGVGKTTLAKLLAKSFEAHFIELSAVMSGVKEIRNSVDQAQKLLNMGKRTVLFADEVHRFNKSQQDAFLPFVEEGVIVFIGATTENPSFSLNNALLSRVRCFKLNPISDGAMVRILDRGVKQLEQDNGTSILLADKEKDIIIEYADGDARKALNLLEICTLSLKKNGASNYQIDSHLIKQNIQSQLKRFDNKGDVFYDQISALHKSVRGSSPDGALYWLARMIQGGCDPLYIARRVVRMASEDIGNADPKALTLALSAWESVERLGSPEGELALAQAVSYLSVAPKSNAVYTAWKQALKLASSGRDYPVPLHLRNAPTRLLKQEGHGKGYRYAHDEPYGYAAGENYLPEEIETQTFYHPVDRGLEIKIQEKLMFLHELDKQAHE